MAHRLNFTVPYKGMAYIWNVTQSVGTETSEVNAGTDVRLIKLLINCVLDLPGAGSSIHPSLRGRSPINDVMDHALAFWIYYAQVEGKFPADGAVSPSPKFPSFSYLVVRMNWALYNNNRPLWEGLPDHPQCGMALRTELLAPPR